MFSFRSVGEMTWRDVKLALAVKLSCWLGSFVGDPMGFKCCGAASAAALLLIAPGMALAATEVVTATVPSDGSTLIIEAFDSHLGTLTSVTLGLDANVTLQSSILNFGSGTTFDSASTTAMVSVYTPLPGPITLGDPIGTPLIDTIFTTSATNGTVSPGVSITALPAVTSSQSASVSVLSSDFGNFESLGASSLSFNGAVSDVALTLAGASTASGSGPSEAFGGSAVLNSGTFTITYGYTAVPEPAAWALMILGFGGAGAMLRSRQRAGAQEAVLPRG